LLRVRDIDIVSSLNQLHVLLYKSLLMQEPDTLTVRLNERLLLPLAYSLYHKQLMCGNFRHPHDQEYRLSIHSHPIILEQHEPFPEVQTSERKYLFRNTLFHIGVEKQWTSHVVLSTDAFFLPKSMLCPIAYIPLLALSPITYLFVLLLRSLNQLTLKTKIFLPANCNPHVQARV